MFKLIYRVLGLIPVSGAFERNSEPFLIQSPNFDIPALLTFYQNDILGGQSNYYKSFTFLKNNFLPEIKWALLCLLFKKLCLFQKSVYVLEVKYTIAKRL